MRVLQIFLIAGLLAGVGCAVKHTRNPNADKVIEAYKSERQGVQDCYERSLETEPLIQGQVTLVWTVAGKGKVQAAAVKSSTTGSTQLETCLLNHLKSVEFPHLPALSKITVEYTLGFDKQTTQE